MKVKDWIIAWIEKKLGIVSPSASVNGYRYRYDWFMAMADKFHWYKRYPNSYPRYAITPISDSIIVFVPKYAFIIPLPQFLVDRNTRKWLDERSRRC